MSKQSYYGRPIVKPPAWTDLIPVYFWSGGMAGTAATLALMERLAKNHRMARTLLFGAAIGSGIGAFCLIADLKRPERFLKMLRVFKPTSPMSVGVYIFSAFSGSVFIASAAELTAVAKPVGRFFEGLAGLIGPFMSIYTAVLIGDTVMPAWSLPKKTMAPLFAATSASTAGGWAMLFGPVGDNGSARRVAALGGTATVATLQALHREIGPVQEQAYSQGEAGAFSQLARACTIAGTLCAVLAQDSKLMSRLAGALLLGGGLAERFAVYRAGCASAKDPKFIVAAQAPEPQTA